MAEPPRIRRSAAARLGSAYAAPRGAAGPSGAARPNLALRDGDSRCE
jgi:hypothetical protein